VILYYALGGGLGHLSRARKVLGERDDAVLLTASRHARDPRVTAGRPVIPVPRRLGEDRAAFRAWLTTLLQDLSPDELLVDAFPGGILGELCGLELPPARLVARALRWDVYARRLDGPLPRYDAVHALEPLPYVPPGRLEPLTLPHAEPTTPLSDEPHTLVVHAGPEAELERLLAHARGPTVIVHPRHTDVYPAEPHLAFADHIVTGAGFNAIHETAPYRERHTAVPLPRPLDNQHARAIRIRT
jgi:predicted glycosyltransferase